MQNSDSPTKMPHLLRADRDRRLHAGRPREGRQVRLEHAQGQGNPRLPAGQHAASVPRSGDAAERHRSAEGRQAQQQRRDPGARRLLARRPEPVRASSSSRTPRSSSSTARRISSPRSARPSALPTTRPSWRPTNTSRRIPTIIQSWTDAIYRAQKWTAAAAGRRGRQGDRAVLPGRQSEGAGRRRRALPQAQDLEDHAGDRAGGDRASSRTSWCRATCSTTAKRVKFEDLVLTEFANKAK